MLRPVSLREKVDYQPCNHGNQSKEGFRWFVMYDVSHHVQGDREKDNRGDRVGPDFIRSFQFRLPNPQDNQAKHGQKRAKATN